jgi:hypothetical protein
MRQTAPSNYNRKIIDFRADLQFENTTLKNLLCQISVAQSQNDISTLEIRLERTVNFNLKEIPFIFSLKSSSANTQDNDLLIVSADKVYNLGFSTFHAATDQEYSILKAEPVNLKIEHFFPRNNLSCQNSGSEDNQKYFCFWLSQSQQLIPLYSTTIGLRGDFSVKTHSERSFDFPDGIKLGFSSIIFTTKML